MRARNPRECSLLLLLLVLLFQPISARAQSGRQLYEERCAMCHSIGGEPAAGPDLTDITKRRDREWLLRFIRDPEAAAKSDRDAAALVKQFDNAMPATEGASRAELEAVLDYIAAQSASPARSAADGAPAAVPEVRTDAALGRDLYAGRRTFASGAPACVACHRFGAPAGGALGPDLSGVHQRLGGTLGLTRWMENPPTSVMRAVYRRTPLSPEESHALVTVLADASAQTPAPSRVPAVFAAGLGGAGAALVLFAVVWSRRFRGVRRRMLARAGGGQR